MKSLIFAVFIQTQAPLPVPLIAYEITEQPATLCGKGHDVCVVREPKRCVIVQHPFAAPADVEIARVACYGNQKGKLL